jgi:Domain of unknown function (DUF4783)
MYMKAILFVLFLMPSILLGATPPSFNAIAKAMSSGDVEMLSKYLANSVEISILSQEDIYDKAQAVATLRDFFQKNKPKNFTQVHSGSAKGKAAEYSICDLSTSVTNYRVYVYMAVVNDNYVIQELRFDKP